MTTTDNSNNSSSLQHAREHIFSLGLDDSAARLCAANMVYGMAKVNHVLQLLSYPADTTFIATPDMTITRNTARWQAGFGYGGKLQWGDGDRPLIVLDVKPNGCGMLVGGLARQPRLETLLARLHELTSRHTIIDGITVQWDFARGNHFIDVCQVSEVGGDFNLPPCAFVMHGSCPELHGPTDLGPGAYWDASPPLRRLARRFDTPWGPLHCLLDEQVAPYLEFWQRAETFAAQRRLVAAQALFGDFETLANVSHQGLRGPNCILLGCQDTTDPQHPLLPIMVRSDLPGYLFRGLPNLTPATMDQLGFTERARQLGVQQRLLNANVLPHGAGYALPHLREVVRVVEAAEARYFEMSTVDGQTTEVLDDLHDVQQKYRGRQPVLKAIECDLGQMVARLTPQYVVKV